MMPVPDILPTKTSRTEMRWILWREKNRDSRKIFGIKAAVYRRFRGASRSHPQRRLDRIPSGIPCERGWNEKKHAGSDLFLEIFQIKADDAGDEEVILEVIFVSL